MPQLIIAVDEPSKGLKIQGRKVKKPNISEDNWSRSKHEMDISAVQLQRSISSMSTSNQNLDPHGSSGSRSNPEFVNNGKFQTAFFSLFGPTELSKNSRFYFCFSSHVSGLPLCLLLLLPEIDHVFLCNI